MIPPLSRVAREEFIVLGQLNGTAEDFAYTLPIGVHLMSDLALDYLFGR